MAKPANGSFAKPMCAAHSVKRLWSSFGGTPLIHPCGADGGHPGSPTHTQDHNGTEYLGTKPYIILKGNAIKLFALLILLTWLPFIWAGETAYITDQLVVQMRAGKGLDYKILEQLESGTPVSILQRDSKSGYSKVQLEDGQRGWVLERFLTETPPARVKLPALEQKLQQLTAENKQLKQALTSLTAQQAQVASDRGELSDLTARLQSELKRIRKTAANALEIEAERNQLRERVVLLERELQKVKLEKQALESESTQSWFAIGAGVLFAGIVLGLVLPRLGWRRKPGWDTL